jgi:serine/threonine protein kinase
LVQYRYAGDINVKFAGFGISRERRESGNWKAICGTWKYVAPEIMQSKKHFESGGGKRKRYTAAVDIWSLGVVMFKLLSGLPRYEAQYEHQGAFWGEKILKKLGGGLETETQQCASVSVGDNADHGAGFARFGPGVLRWGGAVVWW